MKEWTKHEARSAQTVEAGQFNAEQRSFRSQAIGLDRSQYPEGCLAAGMLKTNAMHKVWTFALWDTGVDGADGEQTVVRAADADTAAYQFRGVTYQGFGTGWLTGFETTLTGHQGGSLLTEWFGLAAIQGFFAWTQNADYKTGGTPVTGIPNEKYLGLRILYNGVTVVERIGPAKPMDAFSITGEAQAPTGNVVVTFQFKPVGAGPDDPIEDTATNDHLLQAHLFGNRVTIVGRWR